ncbi:hypothetical protein [Phytoactinopolyspora mesophila]|nr:hypothetical protein [Phytoactinopolyspora mesophila]
MQHPRPTRHMKAVAAAALSTLLLLTACGAEVTDRDTTTSTLSNDVPEPTTEPATEPAGTNRDTGEDNDEGQNDDTPPADPAADAEDANRPGSAGGCQ